MNMRTWAATAVAVLALSACGGGSGDDPASESPETSAGAPSEEASDVAAAPTMDEWVDQALEECEAVNKATADAEPEGDPFSPQATKADQQQGIEFLSTFGTSMRTFAGNLEEIGYPAENADAAEGLVTAAETSAQAFEDAAAAAKEDFAKAQGPVGKAFGTFGQLEAAAKEVGIGDLENCKREGKKAEEVAAGANEVPVEAVETDGTYLFKFDKTVAAGKTAFVMENKDDEPHFMALVQLTEPGALDKALQAEAKGDSKAADKFIKSEDVGGSEEAAPGEQAVANVDLKPGTYGMLCFIPGPDGKPHAFNGMAIEFAVK